MTAQQRIDQTEQAPDAAPMQLHEGASVRTGLGARGRVGKKPAQRVGQRECVGDLHGPAAFDQEPRDVAAIGIVGTDDHRNAERRRLEHVVSADRHQTAADEGDIGRRVQRGEFAHAVDQQHLRVRPHHGRAAAPLETHGPPREQCGHAVEALRMPRHQQQQNIGLIHTEFFVGVEQLLLFAAVGAAGYPDGP